MNACEFIKKLKDEIRKAGYKPSELAVNNIVSHGSDSHEVYLYTKSEELIYLVIENN